MHAHIVCARILSVQLYHQSVVRKVTRPDLAEMLVDLARKTVAAEQPALAAHGLSMWGYIVLSALDRSTSCKSTVTSNGSPTPMTAGLACSRSPSRAVPSSTPCR